jgi:hypothetical protein
MEAKSMLIQNIEEILKYKSLGEADSRIQGPKIIPFSWSTQPSVKIS